MRSTTVHLVIAALMLPATLVAQHPRDPMDEAAWKIGSPTILEYRLALDEITSIYQELRVRLSGNKRMALVDGLAAKVDRMTDQELETWIDSGVDLPSLRTALRDLRDQIDEAQRGANTTGTAPLSKTAGLPDAEYSAVCGSERGNTDAEFAAKVALQIAKGVWSAASRACDETIVVLGAGGNTSLLCIIADEILFAAEAILEDFFFCDDAVNAAEIEGAYERLGHLHGDMDALQADVSLDMKLMIEQNLMIISPNQIIVTYAIPESSGGLLDFVVMVVDETIQTAQDAGLATNFAESFFDQAEVLRADESYKRAFLMYRRAYQEVARLP